MHVLITGGAGFVGSHLSRALASRGHRVVVLDSLTAARPENLAGAAGATLFHGDILDGQSLRRAFAETRPDAVIHFAAVVRAVAAMEPPDLAVRVNIGGLLNLLEAMRGTGMPRGLQPEHRGGVRSFHPGAHNGGASPATPVTLRHYQGSSRKFGTLSL